MSTGAQPNMRLVALAIQIANAAVIADIESEGRRVELESGIWWDVSLMLHPAEHASQVIDQCRQALDYAVAARLVVVHPHRAHLLRIIRR